MTGLDQGEWGSTNSYVCRACKEYVYGPHQGLLAGRPVCTSCRDLYNREREIAEEAVDARWLTKIQSED